VSLFVRVCVCTRVRAHVIMRVCGDLVVSSVRMQIKERALPRM